MGSQGFITCVISDLMAIIQTIKPNKFLQIWAVSWFLFKLTDYNFLLCRSYRHCDGKKISYGRKNIISVFSLSPAKPFACKCFAFSGKSITFPRETKITFLSDANVLRANAKRLHLKSAWNRSLFPHLFWHDILVNQILKQENM